MRSKCRLDRCGTSRVTSDLNTGVKSTVKGLQVLGRRLILGRFQERKEGGPVWPSGKALGW